MSFVHSFVQGTSPWTLLMLHGTGGDEKDLLPLGQAIMPDASILSPMGKVSEGGAARFFRRFAEGVFDVEDLVFRTNELADWLLEAYEEHSIDPGNVVAVGYSNGATMVSALFLLRPEVLRAGIALRPSLPFVPKEVPDLRGKHALFVPGDRDNIVPWQQAYEAMQFLSEAGAATAVIKLNAGHGLTQQDVTMASTWLKSLTDA